MTRYSENHIENEAAYADAIRNRIAANALIGKRRRWIAEDQSREGLIEACRLAWFDERGDRFLAKMWESLEKWGTLTEKQEAAVLASFAKREARIVERRAADLSSQHVGTIGERRKFTLTCSFETGYETQFGYTFVLGFKDDDGNVFIYKGTSAFAQKGEKVTVTATVKDHGERDGVKQTIIARPANAVSHSPVETQEEYDARNRARNDCMGKY